jgi:hypothetical protein
VTEARQVVVPMRVVEAGVLLAVGFGWMARLVDLTPLFRHFLGIRPGPPQFAMVDPFYPLLRGVVAVALFAYLVGLLWPGRTGPGGDRALSVLAWVLLVIGLVTPAARDMFDRAVTDEAPGNEAAFRSQTHDGGVLQTEIAMSALTRGENPYAIDYGDTEMARARDSDAQGWRRLGYPRNPALGHLPYPPAEFLLPLPLSWASRHALGWYDQRVFYLLAALAFVFVCGLLVEPGGLRRMVWLVAGASQLLLPFVRAGRNDIVLLLWLAVMACLLQRRRVVAAGAVLGLACATKQFAWILAVVFAIWVWVDPEWRGRPARRSLVALAAVFLAFCLPFLLWSPSAFVDDVIAFNLGLSPDAYPLRPDSLGLASLVLGLGWATSLRGGFPMWAAQLAITLPIAIFLLRRLIRQPSAASMLLVAALVLYSALFCSSFFALNYLAAPGGLLLFAALLSRSRPDWPAE